MRAVDEPTPAINGKTGKPMPLGKRFAPGQSGNPSGRPRVVADIRALAQLEGAACIETLIEIRDDKSASPSARALAVQALLDRGYGKPLQKQELSGPDGAPIQVQQVPDDRPVLDGFLVEFSETKAIEGEKGDC